MTKKDFFILIIKLFGLYSIITALFLTLPQNISFLVNDFEISAIVYLTVVLVVVIGLFILLIFKTPYLVKLLKLEKGFDNDYLDFGNLTSPEIVKIATFIIGGFLIINNIPIFINQTIIAFHSSLHLMTITPNYKWNWLVTGLNILIGYLLITNLNFVVRLLKISNKNKK